MFCSWLLLATRTEGSVRKLHFAHTYLFRAAPRLKDAVIEDPEMYRKLYLDLIKMVWTLYNECKLIHADLSEYNLLWVLTLFIRFCSPSRYYKQTLYMIDVSQSVEQDHPHALEFLRKDCTNVIAFFRKYLDPNTLLSIRELFEFVRTETAEIHRVLEQQEIEISDLESDNLDAYVAYLHERLESRPKDYMTSAEAQIEEEVFKNVYIPRSLNEIVDVEKEAAKMAAPKADNPSFFKSMIAEESSNQALLDDFLSSTPIAPSSNADDVQPPEANVPEIGIDAGESSSSDSDSEGSDADSNESEDDSDASDDWKPKCGKLQKKHEDKDEKKDRKNATKEERRLKRQTKIPKAVKKRKEKLASERRKK